MSNNNIIQITPTLESYEVEVNGKKFDCRLSVIDLLFLKGPESGFFINNF